MSADQTSIGDMLAATVPMARTLNLEFLETTPEKAVVALPDQGEFHNHVGGPHAGAMFTLGESASGAIVLAAFGEQLSRAVPLAVSAEIAYKKLAMGPVTATARRSAAPPPRSSPNSTPATAPSSPSPSRSSAGTAR